jgi:hypothetical protein
VLDPSERELKIDKPAMFHDLESGRDLYVDPETARAQYSRRFNEHEETVKTLCANLGVDYVQVSTDQPLELMLFDFIRSRLHRGRKVSRRGDLNVGGAVA